MKILLIIIINAFSLFTIINKSYAENWHEISTNKDDLSKWYIDLDSVEFFEKKTISKSWVKVVYPHPDGEVDLMLTLINHKAKMFQFIQIEKYDSKGKHKHIDSASNIQYIPPGSVMEVLANYLQIKYR